MLRVVFALGLLLTVASSFPGAPSAAASRSQSPPAGGLSALDDATLDSKLKSFEGLQRVELYPTSWAEFRRRAHGSSSVLACHYNWLGIREATIKMADELDLAVVMVSDVTLTTESPSAFVMDLIRDFDIGLVVFQGIVPGALRFAEQHMALVTGAGAGAGGDAAAKGALRAPRPDDPAWPPEKAAPRAPEFAVVYHSGVGVHNVASYEASLIGECFRASKLGAIHLVFLEQDQAAYAHSVGVPACVLVTSFIGPAMLSADLARGVQRVAQLRLGMLGTATRLPVKNFFTQAAAACMFPGAEVHVNTLSRIQGVPEEVTKEWHLRYCQSRFVEHGHLPSARLTQELGRMHINFYVSWTEAVPNVVLNSLRLGVPVIMSDTTHIFDSDPFLHELLVVTRSDDPAAIYQKAVSVLVYVEQYYTEFMERVKLLLRRLNDEARRAWGCFLEDSRGARRCLLPSGKCAVPDPVDPVALHGQAVKAGRAYVDELVRRHRTEEQLGARPSQ